MSLFDNAPVLVPSNHAQSEISPSSGSASSRKRKRNVGSAFSASATQVLLSGYADCWLCGSELRDICHVVARSDAEWTKFHEAGLLSIDGLSDIKNAVVLCPNCHRAYDQNPGHPGFVFFPTDLDWFIEFEKQDHARRVKIRQTDGHRTVRIPPTAKQYHDWQLRQNPALDDNNESVLKGGSYTRYLIRTDFFPRICSTPVNIPIATWHGDPMATLKRTFPVMTNPVVRGIPSPQLHKLVQLSMLYKSHDEEDEAASPGILPDQENESDGGDSAFQHFPGAQVEAGSHRQQQQRQRQRQRQQQQQQEVSDVHTTPVRSQGQYHDQQQELMHRKTQPVVVPPKTTIEQKRSSESQWGKGWQWGPGATAQDKADFNNKIMRMECLPLP